MFHNFLDSESNRDTEKEVVTVPENITLETRYDKIGVINTSSIAREKF